MATIEIIQPGTLRETTLCADWFGILSSILCTVHCSVVPILLSVLPSVAGTQWPEQPIFHQSAAVVCSVLIVVAIVPGYRVHNSRLIAILAGTGLATVFTSAFIVSQGCCRLTEPKLAKSQINLWEAFRSDFRPNDEYCSYVGDAGARIYSPRGYAQQMLPVTTTDRLELNLGVVDVERLRKIQRWLSPCGGAMLILAHGLNLRMRRRSRWSSSWR